MSDVLKQISDIGIVPVIAIKDANNAVPLAKALSAGGLPIAEITFRTEAGQQAIANIAKECPDVLLGAGTVLTTDQVDKAIDAGATYIVTPGIDAKVVEHCQKRGIPVTPGVAVPSDIQLGVSLGLEVLKFFPAESYGGVSTLKAMSAPYNMVKFIPTGGISAKNLMNYLSFPKVIACGGSWMVNADLIDSGKFDVIETMTREAVNVMMGFDLAHIGINTANDAEALSVTQTFAGLFNLGVKEGNSSNFAGTAAEVMKGKGPGTNGHIAMFTNSIPRAMAYLGRRGVQFDMASMKGPEGAPIAVYFKDEIAGFGVHLLQRKL